MVVIDYEKLQIGEYLAEARAAGCRCITVNVAEGQLLYLGNRTADALAAIINDNCEVFFSDYDEPGARRADHRKS